MSAKMITTKHHRWIGAIALNFNDLEYYISIMIWHYLGVNERLGSQITSKMAFDGCVEFLLVLYEQRAKDKKGKSKLKALMNKAKNLSVKRNQVVHSKYLGSSEKPPAKDDFIFPVYRAVKNKGARVESIKLSDLKKLNEEFFQLRKSLNEFLSAYIEVDWKFNSPLKEKIRW